MASHWKNLFKLNSLHIVNSTNILQAVHLRQYFATKNNNAELKLEKSCEKHFCTEWNWHLVWSDVLWQRGAFGWFKKGRAPISAVLHIWIFYFYKDVFCKFLFSGHIQICALWLEYYMTNLFGAPLKSRSRGQCNIEIYS